MVPLHRWHGQVQVVSSFDHVNHGLVSGGGHSGAGKYFQLSSTVRTRNVLFSFLLYFFLHTGSAAQLPRPAPRRKRGVRGVGGLRWLSGDPGSCPALPLA